jgi:hypothetical protein
MGLAISAKCKNCFYKSRDLFVGLGKSRPIRNLVPAFDLKTNKLVTENYYDKEQLGGKVIFYNQPEMFTHNEIALPVVARVRNKLEKLFIMLFNRRTEKRRKEQEAMEREWKEINGKEKPIEWFYFDGKQRVPMRLNRHNNMCPKCKKYAMTFEGKAIFWD